MGRFTGIDPQGFTPENIQSFNRYAYANNNPYRYVDPNGESPLDIVFFAIDTVRFGAAVASGNPAAIASAGMDLAASTVGLISPIPGSGQVIKAGLAARKVAKAAKTFCFVKGTLIHTQHGLTPIEDIQVGDVVASKDELTGETRWKPVVQLFRNYDKPILNIRVVNVNGKVDVLGVTPEHPFWVEGFGWLEAGALQEGHELLDVSGQALRVESVAEDEKLHDTYNFEVKDYHTYFVGEQGAWVHNMCKVPKGADDIPQTIYRKGRSNDSAAKDIRVDDDGVSFRSGLHNAAEGPDVLPYGKPFIAVDTSKLPKGSVVVDNKPWGHVSVNASVDDIVKAIDKSKSGKLK